MMETKPLWPHHGGKSLLLVLLRATENERRLVYSKIAKVADEYGVDVLADGQHAEQSIRSGLESISWLDLSAVLVFRCPRGQEKAEAAPLVELGRGDMSEEVVRAGVDFLTECAGLALASSSRIAFVAARDWQVDDDIRYELGQLDEFRAYIQRPNAWATAYLGRGNEYVVVLKDDLPFWYQVWR